MGKNNSALFDETKYYEQHKDQVKDLGEFTNKYPDLEADTLLLSKSEKGGYATVVYVSPNRNIYDTELGLKDNGYVLLFQLATRPKHIFKTKLEFTQLGEKLKEVGDHTKEKDHYNRIRYAMDFLRDKLRLKNHKDEDPFVSKKGFGLMCNTIIKM